MENRKRNTDSSKPAARPSSSSGSSVKIKKAMTKEDALKQMIEQDPKKAAEILKEILSK